MTHCPMEALHTGVVITTRPQRQPCFVIEAWEVDKAVGLANAYPKAAAACLRAFRPGPSCTCHDVLHHRNEVGRLAEGRGVVILILEGKPTDQSVCLGGTWPTVQSGNQGVCLGLLALWASGLYVSPVARYCEGQQSLWQVMLKEIGQSLAKHARVEKK